MALLLTEVFELEKDLIITLIGVGATIGGVFIGFGLNELSAYIKRKGDEKEKFLMSNYSQRQIAYEDMYIGLNEYKEYFEGFVECGNEFIEHEELGDFRPLEKFTEFRSLVRKNEIWLHTKTAEKTNKIIQESSSACDLALRIATEKEEMWTSGVEPMAKNIIVIIDDAMEHIRKITGMLLLDKYQEDIISKYVY